MTINNDPIEVFSLKGFTIIIGILSALLGGTIVITRMQDQIIATQQLHTYQLSLASTQLAQINDRLSAIKRQITNKD